MATAEELNRGFDAVRYWADFKDAAAEGSDKGLLINYEWCTNCHSCEVACKKHLELPQKLVNVIHCKNPRCITVAESQLDAIFLLSDPAKHTYRCAYCETAIDKKF